jgi:hypothetical protein
MRSAILALLTSTACGQIIVGDYSHRGPFKPPPGNIVITPAIIRNPEQVGAVETDAVMTIREILAGKGPARGQILLVGEGGRQGQWNVTVARSPQVQSSERYLLFGAIEGRIRVDWNGQLRIADSRR